MLLNMDQRINLNQPVLNIMFKVLHGWYLCYNY